MKSIVRVGSFAECSPADAVNGRAMPSDQHGECIDIISLGIGPDEIGAHLREMRFKSIKHVDGMPAVCHQCGRAAVVGRVEWHRVWGVIPLFRRQRYWCEEHQS